MTVTITVTICFHPIACEILKVHGKYCFIKDERLSQLGWQSNLDSRKNCWICVSLLYSANKHITYCTIVGYILIHKIVICVSFSCAISYFSEALLRFQPITAPFPHTSFGRHYCFLAWLALGCT